MRSTHLKRGLVALATALTVLAVMSMPASAATNTGTLTGSGFIKIHVAGGVGTPLYNIPVPGTGGGTPTCSPALPTGSISLSTTGNATSGNWSASTPTPPGPIKSLFTVTGSGNVYQVDLSIVSANGTYNTAGAPAGYTHALASTPANHLILQAKFYRVSPPNCAKTDLRCTMNTRVLLQAGSGFNGTPDTAQGTAKLVATSDTAGGLALTPVGGCDADLSSVNGKHVTAELYFNFP